ncbi:MAG: site-specific integrase [Pirellulaceae bacterium]|nr:site-specific integrase [Pirellulaceae bacterium]
MPKLTTGVPKYSRHKRSGKAVVYLNGAEVYLGTYGTKSSRDRYDAAIAEWLANQRKSSGPPKQTTVAELILAHMKWAKGYYPKNGKPTSQVCLLRATLRVLRRFYGHLPVSEFGSRKLAAFRDLLTKEPSKKKMPDGSPHYLCRNEINRRVRCVRKMFNWGVEHELTESEHVAALKLVSPLAAGRCPNVREGKVVLPVEIADVDKTIPHLPPMVADMVKLQLASGARPTEICIMRLADLDTTSGEVWIYRPTDHKNSHKEGMDRVIALGSTCQGILEKYLGVEPEEFIFNPKRSESQRRAAAGLKRKTPPHVGHRPGDNRVRIPKRSPGKRYTDASYRRCIERACEKAGVEKWTPYQLRHAQATRIADMFGLEAASQVLGHADTNTTRKVYAKTSMGAAAAVAKVLG